MDELEYFLSLIADNESLTGDLPDNLAMSVIKFAQVLATIIARGNAGRDEKEKQFAECMEHVRNLSKSLAGCLENPANPVVGVETEILAAVHAAIPNN